MPPLRLQRYDAAAFASLAAYAAGATAVPVAMVQMSAELGFALDAGGMGAAGGLALAKTLTVVVAMVGSAFFAARWGKRPTLGGAALLMALGTAAVACAPGYGLLLLAFCLAGLGEGGVEALTTPFVEALHPEAPGRYINLTHAFWSVGVVVAVLGTGAWLAAGGSWRVPLAGVASAGLLAAVLVLRPPARGAAYPEAATARTAGTDGAGTEAGAWREAKSLAANGRFWFFFAAMAFAGGGEFGLTFWAASYIQLGVAQGDPAAAWRGGVGTAFFAGGMFLARVGWGLRLGENGLRPLILGSAAAGVAVTALLPLANGFGLLCVLLTAAGVATAPFWPSVQALAAQRLGRKDPTVLFVLLSCAGVPGCGLVVGLMGWAGDRVGLRAAFFVVPACFLALAVLVVAATRAAKSTPPVEARE